MISAIYLSVVGVSSDLQDRALGSHLLADAFKQSADAANRIGAYFLVLDALNESVARTYRKLGFVDLPCHEPRMLMTMKMVCAAIVATKTADAV